MSLTLEQSAEEFTEQRIKAAKGAFETFYSDLLDPLKGSKMRYEVAVNSFGSLQIVFHKPGLSKITLPLTESNKVGSYPEKQELTPEQLTTLLADHIVRQEVAIEKADELKVAIKNSQRRLGVSLSLFGSLVLLHAILGTGSTAHILPTKIVAVAAIGMFIFICYFIGELYSETTKYHALKPSLPSWFR